MSHAARRASIGWTLAEALVVLAVAALALAVALPAMAELQRSARVAAAARALATEFLATRWAAVATGRGRGFEFARDDRGWHWYVVEDGNGNGLRVREIREGVDRRLSGPHRIENTVSGTRIGLPPGGPFRDLPSRGGRIDGDDPVRLGASDLLAFLPLGTSSSGTLFVTDGHRHLYAIVVYGATCRVRVWRYDVARDAWVL